MTQETGDGLAGQQGLSAAASEFNVLDATIRAILGTVSTTRVVKVMAVTNEGALAAVGFVDVMPMVNQVDGLGKSTPHATIYGVPYLRLQGGDNAIIIDPKVGDLGLMVVSDRDISSVKANKAQANPGSKRRFDMADGIYVGGILNGIPKQYVMMNADGIKIADNHSNVIELKSDGIFFTSTNVTVTGSLTVVGDLKLGGTIKASGGGAYGGAISTSGTITGGTDVVGGGFSLKTHRHNGVTTGGGTSGTPVL